MDRVRIEWCSGTKSRKWAFYRFPISFLLGIWILLFHLVNFGELIGWWVLFQSTFLNFSMMHDCWISIQWLWLLPGQMVIVEMGWLQSVYIVISCPRDWGVNLENIGHGMLHLVSLTIVWYSSKLISVNTSRAIHLNSTLHSGIMEPLTILFEKLGLHTQRRFHLTSVWWWVFYGFLTS